MGLLDFVPIRRSFLPPFTMNCMTFPLQQTFSSPENPNLLNSYGLQTSGPYSKPLAAPSISPGPFLSSATSSPTFGLGQTLDSGSAFNQGPERLLNAFGWDVSACLFFFSVYAPLTAFFESSPAPDQS